MRLRELFESSVLDNPNFKRWFGNSVVVNSDGSPLRLYHGTNKDFHAFKGMVWASTHPELSNEYSGLRAAYQQYGSGDARTIPLYMKITQVFDADKMHKDATVQLFFEALRSQATENGHVVPDKLEELEYIVQECRREEESGPHYDRHNFWDDTRSYFGSRGADAIKNGFDICGFDGIKYTELGHITYGVFSPTQVKSAVGNRGTYDDTANLTENNFIY